MVRCGLVAFDKQKRERVCMIEPIRETQVGEQEQLSGPASRITEGKQLRRRLSALEIAEGALLADIGVVLHVLIRILPVGSTALSLLVPAVFALLTLRRGLYVACMSLCVAVFLIAILLGLGGGPLLLLEAGAGLYLGLTMRHRLGHMMILVVGVLAGGLTLAGALLAITLLGGGPALLVRSLRVSFEQILPIAGTLFRLVHLGHVWQTTLLPLCNRLLAWGLQHWLLLLCLLCWVFCIPVVIIVYGITNILLRLLGYSVRPFPGTWLEGWLYRVLLFPLRLLPRRIVYRTRILHLYTREVRRLNRGRLRQAREARERA
jgi:hypothetical protein